MCDGADASYKHGLMGPEQFAESHFFQEGRTVYVATDEQDKKFFEPMSKHCKVLFLSDVMDQLTGMDPNFFGMIEQLVIARGDKFVGTYFLHVHGLPNTRLPRSKKTSCKCTSKVPSIANIWVTAADTAM
jgi:GDP-fucose protein O-fucosyltransferase